MEKLFSRLLKRSVLVFSGIACGMVSVSVSNPAMAERVYSAPDTQEDLMWMINAVSEIQFAQNIRKDDQTVIIEGLTQNDLRPPDLDELDDELHEELEAEEGFDDDGPPIPRVPGQPEQSDLNTLSNNGGGPGEANIDLQGEAITLNFQDADIRALINTVSQVSGKNFVVDPRVKGRVTLVSGSKIPAMQLYDIFLSVLSVHNFSAVEQGNLVKILPSNLIKQTPTPTEYGSTRFTNDEQITQIYNLQHSSVQEMVPILRPLLPPTSHFAAHAGSNTLVFTDVAANVSRVIDIIKRLDQPDRRSDVHVVYLKYASATRLAQIISQTAASISAGGDGGTPIPTPQNQISVQADQSLNALIIQSPEAEFRMIQALIDQLDVERADTGKVHVVYLKYAKSTDLVSLLGQVVQNQGGGAEGAQDPNRTQISVQADESTNALVIRAEEDDFRDLKAVIEKLDLRREQVFVEVIIAEIASSNAADFGIDWEGAYRSSSGATYEPAISTGASADGGLKIGVVSSGFTQIGDNLVPDLTATLRLLRTNNNANILSTPNLLTLDNETAEINVGQEVPFVTGQFTTSGSTTTTTPNTDNNNNNNANNNTNTGVVNPFQTIERKDVGISLKITPQINEGNTIILEMEQEISSVSETTVAGASDLITDTRSLNATVQVDDGQIIVLGGLIRDDVQDNLDWVPVLGKIPLIGALFRKKAKNSVKTNLMVFMRPKIIRTAEDLAAFTRDRYDFIREQQDISLPDTERMIRRGEPAQLPSVNWQRELDRR